MNKFFDWLAPKGETLHILLKREEKVVAAVYVEDTKEIRSKNLKGKEVVDESSSRDA